MLLIPFITYTLITGTSRLSCGLALRSVQHPLYIIMLYFRLYWTDRDMNQIKYIDIETGKV